MKKLGLVITLGLCIFGAKITAAQETERFENHDGSEFEQVTPEVALERSRGQVVLHVGNGYSAMVVHLNINRLAEVGLPVSVYFGGPDGGIRSYFFGNPFPDQTFNEDSSTEMVGVLIQVARSHKVID